MLSMKNIIVLLYSLFLPIYSLKPTLCINCKFLIKEDILFFGDAKYGKCSRFPCNDDNYVDYLITGKQKIEYQYCSIVRKYPDMCGKEGIFYKPKRNK